jgi:hypothetical protein
MRLLALSALALLVLAAPAAAEVRAVAEVHTPDRGGRTAFPVIDAFDGRVVWSDYDAASGAWRLMEHVGGVTRAVPVAPRQTPFDVDLGPDGRRGAFAVYSRCSRRILGDLPTPPLGSRLRGCDLYRYSFSSGREVKLARVSTRADETWPTVWRSRLAFVRAGDRSRSPRVYRRSGRVRLPSPVIEVRESGPEGTTVERVRLPYAIDGLDLRGRTVAYVWRRADDFDTVSFVYSATAGGALRPAARGATYGGGAAVSSRSMRDVALARDGVDWLFTNVGDPEYFGSFLHRARTVKRSPRSKAVAFARDADAAYWIDGGPGAEFDATEQPGGTFALLADDAVAYRAVPRGWLPIRPPAGFMRR